MSRRRARARSAIAVTGKSKKGGKSENGFALQRFAIPDQAIAAVFVPIAQHPALNMDAVYKMVVGSRLVRMAVNHRGVGVIAQQIFRRAGIEIAINRVAALTPGTAPTDVTTEQGAHPARFGAHAALPFRVAYLGAVSLIGRVV